MAAGGKWTPPNLAIIKRISVPWHCDPAKCSTSILVLFHVQLLEAEVVMKGDSFSLVTDWHVLFTWMILHFFKISILKLSVNQVFIVVYVMLVRLLVETQNVTSYSWCINISFLILILEIRRTEQVSRFQQLLDFCSHKIDNRGYVLFYLLFTVKFYLFASLNDYQYFLCWSVWNHDVLPKNLSKRVYPFSSYHSFILK